MRGCRRNDSYLTKSDSDYFNQNFENLCNILKCISGLWFCEFLLNVEFQMVEDKEIWKYIDQHGNKNEESSYNLESTV